MAHIQMAKLVAFPVHGFARICVQHIMCHIKLSGRRAAFACAVMFNDGPRNCKTIWGAVFMAVAVSFFDVITTFANEKFRDMARVGMITGDIGVQRLNAVHKAQTREKIKGAVDRRRLRRTAIRPQLLEKIFRAALTCSEVDLPL